MGFPRRQSQPYLWPAWIMALLSVGGAAHQHFNDKSGSDQPLKPVFELEVYHLRPPLTVPFLEGVRQKYHLRTRHSPMLGYWTIELEGALNQGIALWEYKSMEQRAEVRTALVKDQRFIDEFLLPYCLPAVEKMDRLLLRPLDDTKVTPPTGSGVVELLKFQMRGPESAWGPALREFANASATNNCTVIASFRTLVGPMNQVVLLLQHSSQDALLSSADSMSYLPEYEILQKYLMTSSNEMLLPLDILPA